MVLISVIEMGDAGIIIVMGCPLVVRVTVSIWIRYAVAGGPFKKSSGTERTSPFPTARSLPRCYCITVPPGNGVIHYHVGTGLPCTGDPQGEEAISLSWLQTTVSADSKRTVMSSHYTVGPPVMRGALVVIAVAARGAAVAVAASCVYVVGAEKVVLVLTFRV